MISEQISSGFSIRSAPTNSNHSHTTILQVKLKTMFLPAMLIEKKNTLTNLIFTLQDELTGIDQFNLLYYFLLILLDNFTLTFTYL